jgi:3-oxoacyl-[acyl-carrier-protein] synthase-3
MAIGLENGFVQPGENEAMLGIGSGINSLMLAVQWQKTLYEGSSHAPRHEHRSLAAAPIAREA